MDQVLFSEPSTRMKERMEQMRTKVGVEAADSTDGDNATSDKSAHNGSSGNLFSGISSSASSNGTDISPEEAKFLEDKFGKR